MHDPAVRVRRAAIGALGKLGADAEDARAALIARWDAAFARGEERRNDGTTERRNDGMSGGLPAGTPDEGRTLVEAMGKLGGEAVLARLRALDPRDDAELARRRDRALLMADRDARRDAESTIATDVAFGEPLRVRLHCRPGFADLLHAELGYGPMRRAAEAQGRSVTTVEFVRMTQQHGARASDVSAAVGKRGVGIASDSAVDLFHTGPWSTLFHWRLWTTAGIRVPLASQAPADIVAAILASRPLLTAWTRGPIRWRLGFASGHRRAVVWQVARDVTAAAPELLNDPTATTWDALVDGDALEWVPRRAHDPRFAWRVADVPASSHPTVAAALVFLAGWRDGERVWDPFCGAALELVERGLRGPCTLIGSDVDASALAAARENLAAARVDAQLELADARAHDPGTVDAIITNPPLGSRVQLDAAQLLADALPNLVRRLAPGGRLVWITPAPRRTGPAAERAGLQRVFDARVDLGGVRGVLERWERRATTE